MPNGAPPELVDRSLTMTEQCPTRSYLFVARQFRFVGSGFRLPRSRRSGCDTASSERRRTDGLSENGRGFP